MNGRAFGAAMAGKVARVGIAAARVRRDMSMGLS
jgi:hypothetical protein